MNKDMDIAIDFARANKWSNAFCAKMLRVFEVTGNLTRGQINALLQIKANQ